ncbi:hypothetical protein CROQUDRAFT_13724, partial [Cronartium quercuum f. sp. fusiforme G11]
PTVLTMDSNLHSPIWNPAHDPSHDSDADRLIETMTNWNLLLCSPKGIPTFGLNRTNTQGMSIDLVWVNEEANDLITACFIDSNDEFNHNSDHQALTQE